MLNCASLDSLVTPYVDGELTDADRRAVDQHLRVCPPCYTRVAAERAVHELVGVRREGLCRGGAPDALRGRCAALARDVENAVEAKAAKTQSAAKAVVSFASPFPN